MTHGGAGVAFVWHGDRVLARLRAEMARRLDRAGVVIAERARQLAPVDTGALRDTIRHEVDAGGATLTLRVTAGGGAVDYAGHVVAGRPAGRPPRPFLADALRGSLPEVRRILKGGTS